jgi:hypothetical protein
MEKVASASRMPCLARLILCDMMASGTKKARAISALTETISAFCQETLKRGPLTGRTPAFLRGR